RTPGRDPRLLSRRYRCSALRRSTHAPTTYHPARRARGRGGRSAPSPDRRTPAPAPSPPTPPRAHHDPRPTDRPRSTPRRRPAHPRLAYPPSNQMGVTEFGPPEAKSSTLGRHTPAEESTPRDPANGDTHQ